MAADPLHDYTSACACSRSPHPGPGSRYRGLPRKNLWAYLVAAAYNLLRMVKLMPAPA